MYCIYSVSIHSGDDWFRGLADTAPVGQEVTSNNLGIGLILHFFDISSSSECLFTSGDDYGTYIFVCLEPVQSLSHFTDEAITKSVEGLGSVEGYDTYGALGPRGVGFYVLEVGFVG